MLVQIFPFCCKKIIESHYYFGQWLAKKSEFFFQLSLSPRNSHSFTSNTPLEAHINSPMMYGVDNSRARIPFSCGNSTCLFDAKICFLTSKRQSFSSDFSVCSPSSSTSAVARQSNRYFIGFDIQRRLTHNV